LISTGSLFSGATFTLNNQSQTWIQLPNTGALYTPVSYTQNGQTFVDIFRIIQVLAKIIFFVWIPLLIWYSIWKKLSKPKRP
jgi:hypothetical protein